MDIAVRTFHIKLHRHQCSLAIRHDPWWHRLLLCIVKRKALSLTPRPNGLDKSKITRHFPGWYFFGTTPKRLKAWNSRYRAGASYATFLKFCEDTLINHRWVKRRWWHILGRKPQQYRWRIKAKKKTNSNTRNHKIHFSLIRVKTKFPRQFICNKGGGGG